MVDQLTVIEIRIGDERFGGWTFEAGISGSGGVANALQVVMPEGRTPGRHDGRDAEVRRFSPFPFRRHPFSPPTTHFDSLDFSLALSLLFFLSFHTVLFLPLLFFASSLYLSSRSLSLSLFFPSFPPSFPPTHPPSHLPPPFLPPFLFPSPSFFLSSSSSLYPPFFTNVLDHFVCRSPSVLRITILSLATKLITTSKQVNEIAWRR